VRRRNKRFQLAGGRYGIGFRLFALALFVLVTAATATIALSRVFIIVVIRLALAVVFALFLSSPLPASTILTAFTAARAAATAAATAVTNGVLIVALVASFPTASTLLVRRLGLFLSFFPPNVVLGRTLFLFLSLRLRNNLKFLFAAAFVVFKRFVSFDLMFCWGMIRIRSVIAPTLFAALETGIQLSSKVLVAVGGIARQVLLARHEHDARCLLGRGLSLCLGGFRTTVGFGVGVVSEERAYETMRLIETKGGIETCA
jgi:hypothetical protein